MGKEMIQNSEPSGANATKLSLNGVLTKALGDLIDPDDIILADKDKEKTKQEQDILKEQIMRSLINDITKITATVIKGNYGISKEEIITKINDKFLEQKRGEENLETPEGRVAKAIRDKAGSGFFSTTNDDRIKNELAKKINRILGKPEVQTALAVEGTGKNLAKDGVAQTPSLGEKIYDAAKQGVENTLDLPGKISSGIFPNPGNSVRSSVHGRP